MAEVRHGRNFSIMYCLHNWTEETTHKFELKDVSADAINTIAHLPIWIWLSRGEILLSLSIGNARLRNLGSSQL